MFLVFLRFCRGIRSSGVTCFQYFHCRKWHVYRENQRHYFLISFSLMFLTDFHLTSEDRGRNKPWRHCVNNTLYNIPYSLKWRHLQNEVKLTYCCRMQTNAHRQNYSELCLQEFTFHKGQQGESLGTEQRHRLVRPMYYLDSYK